MWQLYTGPEVPDDVPIGECRRCKHQIYEDDLDELDDKEKGLACIECGSNDLDLKNKLIQRIAYPAVHFLHSATELRDIKPTLE